MIKGLVCTNCGEMIVKSTESDIKIRSKVLIFKGVNAFAICKGCDEEIPVPISLDESTMKSISTTKKLRLFVKNTK